MSGDIEAVIRRFMEIFSSGDVAGVVDAMDPEGTWWVAGTMPISGTYSREEFGRLLADVGSTCEGPIVLDPKSFIVSGDLAAVETESFARTHAGKNYNNHYHFLFEVRNGKILRVKEYLDTMHTNEVLCS